MVTLLKADAICKCCDACGATAEKKRKQCAIKADSLRKKPAWQLHDGSEMFESSSRSIFTSREIALPVKRHANESEVHMKQIALLGSALILLCAAGGPLIAAEQTGNSVQVNVSTEVFPVCSIALVSNPGTVAINQPANTATQVASLTESCNLAAQRRLTVKSLSLGNLVGPGGALIPYIAYATAPGVNLPTNPGEYTNTHSWTDPIVASPIAINVRITLDAAARAFLPAGAYNDTLTITISQTPI